MAALILTTITPAGSLYAHSGRTAADGCLTIARMAGGTATAATSPLQRHKDYSAETSTTQIALRHELQALLQYERDNLAMLVIWIVMEMA